MGLFSRALAGGIAAGSESISKSITAQEEAAKQEARDRAQRLHAEHMEELRQQYQTTRSDIEYGRKESDMVDKETGRKLTRDELKTAGKDSLMTSAQFEAEQKKLNTAIGFDKHTGLPVYAGDKFDPKDVELTSEMTKKEFDIKMRKYEADIEQSKASAASSRATASHAGKLSIDEQFIQDYKKRNPNATEVEAMTELSKAKAAGKVGSSATSANRTEIEVRKELNSARREYNKALASNMGELDETTDASYKDWIADLEGELEGIKSGGASKGQGAKTSKPDIGGGTVAAHSTPGATTPETDKPGMTLTPEQIKAEAAKRKAARQGSSAGL